MNFVPAQKNAWMKILFQIAGCLTFVFLVSKFLVHYYLDTQTGSRFRISFSSLAPSPTHVPIW